MDDKKRGGGKRGKKGDDDGDDTEEAPGVRKRMKNALRNNPRGEKKRFQK